MTELLDSLDRVADRFDVIVLDQWGVLHDGSSPYPGVIEALARLSQDGQRLAVLSNSGKRAAPNAQRIAAIGYDPTIFEVVMTSGEALWQDLAGGKVAVSRLYPITRAPKDAAAWADGLDLSLTDDLTQADGVLLMGLPDDGPGDAQDVLARAVALGIPIFCTNPDRASPRAGGRTVISPGALAHDAADAGGDVRFYGKPHAPVFQALEAALDVRPDRLLMVGDSLEHDIAGGAGAGWSTLFIRGGLHAAAFSGADIEPKLANLVRAEGAAAPTFSLSTVR